MNNRKEELNNTLEAKVNYMAGDFTFTGSDTLSAGTSNMDSITTTGSSNCYNIWDNYYWPNHNYYHNCNCDHKDKGTQALKILSYLVEEKIIKVDKVKDFIKVMNKIVDVL